MAGDHSAPMYTSVGWLALAAGISSAAMAQQPWQVDEAVKAKAFALLRESKPQRPIARTLQTEESEYRGRFGKKVIHIRSLYVPQEAGLVRLESTTSVGGSQRALVICGLIAVRTWGFLPGDDVTNETSSRLTDLETVEPKICSPFPGAEFSYRTQAERRVRLSANIIIRTLANERTVADIHVVRCKADDSYTPARDILHSLEGDALVVRCERKASNGHTATFEYAFLAESGVYLRLRDQSDGYKAQVRYTEVRYRN